MAALGLLLLFVTACKPARVGGTQSPDLVIDELRRQNLAMEAEIERLQGNINARVAEIEELERKQQGQPAGVPAVPGVATADLPRVLKLQFGRYSSAVDTNADGVDDTVRVYLLTLDQLGRFIPAAGQATVQVVTIAADKGASELAKAAFDPAAFNKAYRTGLTGTHYTLEVKLLQPLPAGLDQITVKVTFTDAATGATLSAEKAMSLAAR